MENYSEKKFFKDNFKSESEVKYFPINKNNQNGKYYKLKYKNNKNKVLKKVNKNRDEFKSDKRSRRDQADDVKNMEEYFRSMDIMPRCSSPTGFYCEHCNHKHGRHCCVNYGETTKNALQYSVFVAQLQDIKPRLYPCRLTDFPDAISGGTTPGGFPSGSNTDLKTEKERKEENEKKNLNAFHKMFPKERNISSVKPSKPYQPGLYQCTEQLNYLKISDNKQYHQVIQQPHHQQVPPFIYPSNYYFPIFNFFNPFQYDLKFFPNPHPQWHNR